MRTIVHDALPREKSVGERGRKEDDRDGDGARHPRKEDATSVHPVGTAKARLRYTRTMGRSLLTARAFDETAVRLFLAMLGLSITGCSGQVAPGSGSGGAQKIGNVYVEPPGQPNTFFASGLAASFIEMSGAGTGSTPTTVLKVEAEGSSCTVTQWMVSTSDPAARVELSVVSAGTLAFAGGQKAALLVPEIQQGPDGEPSVSYALSPSFGGFAPGDAVSITASGADVPPFVAEITVPGAIRVVQPDLSASSLTVQRSDDLPVTWTGGGPVGEVTFGINEGVGRTSTEITCSTPSSRGRGVIPAAALAYLTPASAWISASDGAAFGVYTASATHLTVQDWSIRVVAEPPGSIVYMATIE